MKEQNLISIGKHTYFRKAQKTQHLEDIIPGNSTEKYDDSVLYSSKDSFFYTFAIG